MKLAENPGGVNLATTFSKCSISVKFWVTGLILVLFDTKLLRLKPHTNCIFIGSCFLPHYEGKGAVLLGQPLYQSHPTINDFNTCLNISLLISWSCSFTKVWNLWSLVEELLDYYLHIYQPSFLLTWLCAFSSWLTNFLLLLFLVLGRYFPINWVEFFKNQHRKLLMFAHFQLIIILDKK